MEAINLVLGILIGICLCLIHINSERKLRKTQTQIIRSLIQDLQFYKNLSKKNEEK